MRIQGRIFATLVSLSVFFLLHSCSTPDAAGRAGADNVGAVTIPYTLSESGLFQIDVLVNNEGPFPFILDTGASRSVLFEGLRRQLNIPETGQTVSLHALTGMETRPVITLDSLAIGSIRRENMMTVTLPDGKRDNAVRGIVGLDVLGAYTLYFDGEARMLSFIPDQNFSAKPFRGWYRIELSENPYGNDTFGLRFMVAEAAGYKIPALLDLGSTATLMNWPAALKRHRMKARLSRLREDWQISGAIGEFHPRQLIRLSTLRLGKLPVEGAIVLVMEFSAFDILGAADNPLMIIGADMFRSRSFVLDFAGQQLLVQPRRRDHPPTGSKIRSTDTGSITLFERPETRAEQQKSGEE